MKKIILLPVLFLLVACGSSTLNTEEELRVLNEKYKDTEVPCDYEITSWIALGDNTQAIHSKSFRKYVYTNADFRDLPDTKSVIR